MYITIVVTVVLHPPAVGVSEKMDVSRCSARRSVHSWVRSILQCPCLGAQQVAVSMLGWQGGSTKRDECSQLFSLVLSVCIDHRPRVFWTAYSRLLITGVFRDCHCVWCAGERRTACSYVEEL